VSLTPDRPFVIGREGDLRIDDNPYLHRRFLELSHASGFWWLGNIGRQMTATVTDDEGLMQAWLAPGAKIPLVFQRTMVLFTAGPTTYELNLCGDVSTYVANAALTAEGGETTRQPPTLTPTQRALLVALAEPMLRRTGRGTSSIPSSAQAARRLGWSLTRFNRKLDNVCEKLSRCGIPGLHGSELQLARNRRARLVEYAIATRLISLEDLALLDGTSAAARVTPVPE